MEEETLDESGFDEEERKHLLEELKETNKQQVQEYPEDFNL